jgi:hypothetical protein
MMRPDRLVERRWQALDDGVLAYALAALRSLWIAPLLQAAAWSVSPETRPLLGLPLVLALLAGGTAAAQGRSFLLAGRRAAPALALASLAAVVAALYLSFAGEGLAAASGGWPAAPLADPLRALATVVLAAWLWWWGLLAGRERLSYDGLARNFVGGLAALLGMAALNSAVPFLPAGALLPLLLAFVGLGLFLLALARIQEARRFESARADHALPLARHWWSTVGAVVAALLLVGLLISRVAAPASLDGIAAAAGALLGLVGQIASGLLLIVSYPIFWLLAWLAPLLQLDQLAVAPPATSVIGNYTPLEGADLQGQAALSPAVQAAFGAGVALGAGALILLAFLFALRRLRVYAEDDVDEAHESILSLDLIRAQLAQLWRCRGEGGAPPEPFVRLDGDDPATQVRRTYQALLAWAAGRGVERSPSMTPDRFRRLLAETWPQHRKQLALITAAYDRARYGPAEISDEIASGAAAAWRQIAAATDSLSAR